MTYQLLNKDHKEIVSGSLQEIKYKIHDLISIEERKKQEEVDKSQRSIYDLL